MLSKQNIPQDISRILTRRQHLMREVDAGLSRITSTERILENPRWLSRELQALAESISSQDQDLGMPLFSDERISKAIYGRIAKEYSLEASLIPKRFQSPPSQPDKWLGWEYKQKIHTAQETPLLSFADEYQEEAQQYAQHWKLPKTSIPLLCKVRSTGDRAEQSSLLQIQKRVSSAVLLRTLGTLSPIDSAFALQLTSNVHHILQSNPIFLRITPQNTHSIGVMLCLCLESAALLARPASWNKDVDIYRVFLRKSHLMAISNNHEALFRQALAEQNITLCEHISVMMVDTFFASFLSFMQQEWDASWMHTPISAPSIPQLPTPNHIDEPQLIETIACWNTDHSNMENLLFSITQSLGIRGPLTHASRCALLHDIERAQQDESLWFYALQSQQDLNSILSVGTHPSFARRRAECCSHWQRQLSSALGVRLYGPALPEKLWKALTMMAANTNLASIFQQIQADTDALSLYEILKGKKVSAQQVAEIAPAIFEKIVLAMERIHILHNALKKAPLLPNGKNMYGELFRSAVHFEEIAQKAALYDESYTKA